MPVPLAENRRAARLGVDASRGCTGACSTPLRADVFGPLLDETARRHSTPAAPTRSGASGRPKKQVLGGTFCDRIYRQAAAHGISFSRPARRGAFGRRVFAFRSTRRCSRLRGGAALRPSTLFESRVGHRSVRKLF